MFFFFVFFFQAEDGIRDDLVTGVQTCALPILIAKDTQYRHSISNTGSIHQPIGNQSQTSVQELEEEVCPPKEFMGLKNGGRRNSYIVEGILFRSGRLWTRAQPPTLPKFKHTQLIITR